MRAFAHLARLIGGTRIPSLPWHIHADTYPAIVLYQSSFPADGNILPRLTPFGRQYVTNSNMHQPGQREVNIDLAHCRRPAKKRIEFGMLVGLATGGSPVRVVKSRSGGAFG